MKQIGVQKIFWDAFELAISTQARRLAKDIADAVGQDPEPLLLELKNEKVSVYLFEDSTLDDVDVLDMRCRHSMPICGQPSWRTPCLEPVIWSTNPVGRVGACLHHALTPEPRDPKWKEMLQWEYDDVTYYISATEGLVYSAEGTLCGRYDAKKKKVVIFEIMDD